MGCNRSPLITNNKEKHTKISQQKHKFLDIVQVAINDCPEIGLEEHHISLYPWLDISKSSRHISSWLLMPRLFHNNVESSWILPSANMASPWLPIVAYIAYKGQWGTLTATSTGQSSGFNIMKVWGHFCQKFFFEQNWDEATSNWDIVHRESNVYTQRHNLKWEYLCFGESSITSYTRATPMLSGKFSKNLRGGQMKLHFQGQGKPRLIQDFTRSFVDPSWFKRTKLLTPSFCPSWELCIQAPVLLILARCKNRWMNLCNLGIQVTEESSMFKQIFLFFSSH